MAAPTSGPHREATVTGQPFGESRRSFRPVVKVSWAVEFEVLRGRTSREPRDSPGTASLPARYRAWTRDVGIGGACIVSAARPAPADRLRIWLAVPEVTRGHTALRLEGEVRWVSDGADPEARCEFGVAFLGMTTREEMLLHGYFARGSKLI